MKEDYQIAKKKLILLYQTIKVRKIEGPDNKSNEEFKTEKERLKELPLKTIVGYIDSSIDAIVSMKLNEIRQSKPGPLMDDDINAAREYETLLRKLEGTVRQNFSVINHIKISLDNSRSECDDLKNEITILKSKLKKAKANNKLNEDLLPGVTIYEELVLMKKKLQQYEEQYLQSLKQENSLKQQLLEKNKEIQRLEIRTNNQINTPLNYTRENDKEQIKDNNRNNNGSLILQPQCKFKLASKESTTINNSNNNNNDNQNSKIISQDIPSAANKNRRKEDNKLDKYIKYIDKGDHTLTRNNQNANHQSCRSVSLIKGRSSDEISFLLKRNEQRKQRLNQASMKVLMNQEKRNSQSIKLIKAIPPNKKIILPITIHQKNKSDIPVISKLIVHKDISFNIAKTNVFHLNNNTISKPKRNYPNSIHNLVEAQDSL